MGLLAKLSADDHLDAPTAPGAGSREPIAVIALNTSSASSTFTCPTCSHTRGWVDVYRNPSHCYACQPWPTPSLVAELVGDWPADVISRVAKNSRPKPDEATREAAPTLAESSPAGVAQEAAGHAATTLDESEVAEAAAHAAEARRLAFQLDLADRWDDWFARHGLRRRHTHLVAIPEPA